MTSEQYKKLSRYLNDCFNILSEEENFLLENLDNLAELSELYASTFEDSELEYDKDSLNLTHSKVYQLAREIICSINQGYLEDYDKMLKNGVLDFNFDNELDDSTMDWYSDGLRLIDINRQYNYHEVCSLVHEFMHYASSFGTFNNTNWVILTEFISIYFELYAQKYLSDKLGINESKINANWRIWNILQHASAFNWIHSILICYQNFGYIDENSYKYLNEKYFETTKDSFDEECLRLLNMFEEKEKDYRMEIMFEKEFDGRDFCETRLVPILNTNYKYVLGFLLAAYALENVSKDDMVKLVDALNDENNDDKNYLELLNMIGIDISQINFFEYIDIVESMVYNGRRKKK